jgi:hypothetical protein
MLKRKTKRSLLSVLLMLAVSTSMVRAEDAGLKDESAAKSSTKSSSVEPQWLSSYYEFFTKGTGCWLASNANYVNENEPSDAYKVVWTSAIGGNGKKGRLYGLENGIKTPDFWEFRIYWNGASQQLETQQFGHGGVVGEGFLTQESATRYIQIQDFSLPAGQAWRDKHTIELVGETHVTTSYDWDGKEWQKSRSYTWARCQ